MQSIAWNGLTLLCQPCYGRPDRGHNCGSFLGVKPHGRGCSALGAWVCVKSEGAEASLSSLCSLALAGARSLQAAASCLRPLSRGTTSLFRQSQPASTNWLSLRVWQNWPLQFFEPSYHGSSFYLLCEEEEEQVRGKKHPSLKGVPAASMDKVLGPLCPSQLSLVFMQPFHVCLQIIIVSFFWMQSNKATVILVQYHFLKRSCLWKQGGHMVLPWPLQHSCCWAGIMGKGIGINPWIIRNKWFICFQSGPALSSMQGYLFPITEQSFPSGSKLNWQLLQ